MKNLYPHQLVQRPDHVPLEDANIQLDDVVYLQPVDGPPIASRVIYNTPLLGCTTFTGDAVLAPAEGGTPQRVRVRFRLRDVHRVAPARRRPAFEHAA